MKRSLILCLGATMFLGACGDDDDDGPSDETTKDSSVDSGTKTDAAVSMDASQSIDSSIADTGAKDSSAADASSSAAKTYTVPLTRAEETAACTGGTPGASAAGTAVVTISADNSTITVMVTYSGLSGVPSMGHIHSGAVGVSGPVALPFDSNAVKTSPFTQTLTAAQYGAPSGAPATFAGFVDAVKAGNAYVNLHTAACGGGEIRGQIK